MQHVRRWGAGFKKYKNTMLPFTDPPRKCNDLQLINMNINMNMEISTCEVTVHEQLCTCSWISTKCMNKYMLMHIFM
jgi:hypothetical protein